MSRDTLLAPHKADKDRSVSRRMQTGIKPKGLGGLMAWFLTEWSSEVPSRIHGRGVWRSVASQDETLPRAQQGGSLLGSPVESHQFRTWLYNSPTQIDEDGNHLTPMKAALRTMGGRYNDDRSASALFLVAVARSGGDYDGVCFRVGVPSWAAKTVTESLLNRLFDLYRPAPMPRDEAIAV